MPASRRSLRAAWTALLLASCRTAAPPAPAPVEPIAARKPAPAPVEAALPEPPPLAREFRAAWISPVWSGEWPRPDRTPEQQRAALVALLDRARDVGLNAVVLHVRPAADAIYPAARAPWSMYLTGTTGRAPEPLWDPLAFAVQEAHRRGLELHAWFNPFRAAPPEGRAASVSRELTGFRAEQLVRYGSAQWIDPGFPDARRAVLDDILEVVDRYDVDGVHLDDYFYPYVQTRDVRVRVGGRRVTRRENIPFPDDISWERFGRRAGFTSRSEWRRSNIDDFVATLYREVKARHPWVAVGISPFGIWRPGAPAGITGLDAYSEIYADARRWLREGWVDYLAPQLYWPIDGAQSRFTRLDAWWRAENVHGRHIWPGLFTERETARRDAWPAGEIGRQIDTLRAVRANGSEAHGHIHFRMSALRAGTVSGIGDGLRARAYAESALPPAYPWLDGRTPAAPILRVIPLENAAYGATLHLAPADTLPVRWWVLQVQDSSGGWGTMVRPGGDPTITIALPRHGQVVAARAVSRTGMASEPVRVRLP